jgi:hypothetical protein
MRAANNILPRIDWQARSIIVSRYEAAWGVANASELARMGSGWQQSRRRVHKGREGRECPLQPVGCYKRTVSSGRNSVGEAARRTSAIWNC